MRQELEAELRAERSSQGLALDAAALAQVCAVLGSLPPVGGWGAIHVCSRPRPPSSLNACPELCASGRCLLQIRAEAEVQLAAQVRQAQAEQRRAAKEAARLEQQLQQQSAQVQQVAARKEQAQAHK